MMNVSKTTEELGALCAWLLAAAVVAYAVQYGLRKATIKQPGEREEEGVNGVEIEGWKVCPHRHWHYTTSAVCVVDGALLQAATAAQLARLAEIVQHPLCKARFQEDIFLRSFARFLITYEEQEGRQLGMAFAIELYQSGGLFLLKNEQGRLI